ncbi:MAG: AMP-binding protein [Fusobacteriaceae bacterium]
MDFVKNHNKTGIIYDGENISYKELIGFSKTYASMIEMEKDDKAIIYMENRPEYFYAFLGIWDKKGVSVCLDSSFDATELEYYFKDCLPKYIFTSEKNFLNAKTAVDKLELKTEIIVVENIENTYTGDNWVLQSPEQQDFALMLYTSGTTGDPKGVMLTFDNVLVNVEGLDMYEMYDEKDVVLALLPMHHIFPLLGSAIIPLGKGCTIVFLKELSAEAMLSAFQTYKVTIMLGVPRIWEGLHKKIMAKINASPVTRAVFKLAKLVDKKEFSKKIFKKVHDNFGGNIKFFVSGGAKLNSEVAQDFLTLGIDVCEGYGLTETAPMIAFTPKNQVMPGSAGKIMKDVEVKIAEDGEILSRGRNLMMGYYNKPEATAEAIIDGWFHTGDLGEVIGNNVFVTGRKKEMIVLSNGKNINPIEIEMWLTSNSDLIAEIAVIEYEAKLTAVIFPNFQKVQEDGVTNLTETLKWGVIDKYNNEAPAYKKILEVKVLKDELPKTKLGKIRRFMLADLLKGQTEENISYIEPNYSEYGELKEYLEKLKGKKIIGTAHFELDLGLDSLDITEFLAYLQSGFGIKTKQSLLLDYPTVEKLAEYLRDNSTDEKTEEVDWKSELNSVENVEIKTNIVGRIIKALMKPIFIFYIKQKVTGKENLLSTPTIYVGNHQSFMDAPLFNNMVPNRLFKKIYYVAKVKHFDTGIKRILADNSNIIIMDINKNVGETLKNAAAVLKSGGSIVIFPEGARTRDGKINEFKKSFGIVAKELNVPVVPFGIKGAYNLYSSKDKLPKSGTVETKIFPAIRVENLTAEEIVIKSKETIKDWVEN